MDRVEVSRAIGDPATARQRLSQALAIFDELGTMDAAERVRAMLATLS